MPRMEPVEPDYVTVTWTDGQSDDESTCRECGNQFEHGDEILIVFTKNGDVPYCGARCAESENERAVAAYEYRLGI